MPRDHVGARPGFRIHTQSWWAKSNPFFHPDCYEEIMVGFYDDDQVIGGGGTSGEFGFNWYKLDGKPAMRLECYADGFSALLRIPRLMMLLSDLDSGDHGFTADPTPEAFADMLRSIGVLDMTQREMR